MGRWPAGHFFSSGLGSSFLSSGLASAGLASSVFGGSMAGGGVVASLLLSASAAGVGLGTAGSAGLPGSVVGVTAGGGFSGAGSSLLQPTTRASERPNPESTDQVLRLNFTDKLLAKT